MVCRLSGEFLFNIFNSQMSPRKLRLFCLHLNVLGLYVYRPSQPPPIIASPLVATGIDSLLTHLSLDKTTAISPTRYVQEQFHEWKVLYFDFSEACSYRSNCQLPRIGLDNGLTLKRRQAIIWANGDPIHWRIYVALGAAELINIRLPYIFTKQRKICL